jgi:hypothetical protein
MGLSTAPAAARRAVSGRAPGIWGGWGDGGRRNPPPGVLPGGRGARPTGSAASLPVRPWAVPALGASRAGLPAGLPGPSLGAPSPVRPCALPEAAAVRPCGPSAPGTPSLSPSVAIIHPRAQKVR